jgi:hypothetical protein
VWFAYVFLVVAIWGLVVLGITLFNPWDLMPRFYRFNKRLGHIGPLKLGIFFFSEDPTVYRIFMAAIGGFLVVGGTPVSSPSSERRTHSRYWDCPFSPVPRVS